MSMNGWFLPKNCLESCVALSESRQPSYTQKTKGRTIFHFSQINFWPTGWLAKNKEPGTSPMGTVRTHLHLGFGLGQKCAFKTSFQLFPTSFFSGVHPWEASREHELLSYQMKWTNPAWATKELQSMEQTRASPKWETKAASSVTPK